MTAQERTDTEIREATASIMISSDQDYWKVVDLSLEQSTAVANAVQKAVEKVQTDNFVSDVEAELTYYHNQRSESMWHMVKFKELGCEDESQCHRDKTPKRGGAQPKDRGRSMTKCQTTSS